MSLSCSVHKYYFKGVQVTVSPVIIGDRELVQVSRRSLKPPFKLNHMQVNTRFGKVVHWGHVWPDHLIQDFFPELSAEEREFLLTGMTQEEWDELG